MYILSPDPLDLSIPTIIREPLSRCANILLWLFFIINFQISILSDEFHCGIFIHNCCTFILIPSLPPWLVHCPPTRHVSRSTTLCTVQGSETTMLKLMMFPHILHILLQPASSGKKIPSRKTACKNPKSKTVFYLFCLHCRT